MAPLLRCALPIDFYAGNIGLQVWLEANAPHSLALPQRTAFA